jgi:hypothetical protein
MAERDIVEAARHFHREWLRDGAGSINHAVWHIGHLCREVDHLRDEIARLRSEPPTEAGEVEWFDVVREFTGRTWCDVCSSYDHECGCVPDIRARYANRLANKIRDVLASPPPRRPAMEHDNE